MIKKQIEGNTTIEILQSNYKFFCCLEFKKLPLNQHKQQQQQQKLFVSHYIY